MRIGSHRACLFTATGISFIVLVACVVTLAFPLKRLENGLPPFSCLFKVSSSISLACTKSCALFLSDGQFSIKCPGFSQWKSQCALATYYLGHEGLRCGKWISEMRRSFTNLGNNSAYEEVGSQILSVLALGLLGWLSDLLDGGRKLEQ